MPEPSERLLRAAIPIARMIRGRDDIRRAQLVDRAISNDGKPILPDVLDLGSHWDDRHPVMGAWHLWIDGAGRLRMKNGAPSGDIDGVVVGVQS